MKYLIILVIIFTFSLIPKIYSEEMKEGVEEQNTGIKNSENVPFFRLGKHPMLQYQMDDLGTLHYSILEEELKRREEEGGLINMNEQEKISKELKVKFDEYLESYESPQDILEASKDFQKSLISSNNKEEL